MSDLKTLEGKSKTIKLGELEVEIKPRGLEDFDLLLNLSDPEKKAETIKELLRRTLKDAFPDSTDEEIASIDPKYLDELSMEILRVNGAIKQDE